MVYQRMFHKSQPARKQHKTMCKRRNREYCVDCKQAWHEGDCKPVTKDIKVEELVSMFSSNSNNSCRFIISNYSQHYVTTNNSRSTNMIFSLTSIKPWQSKHDKTIKQQYCKCKSPKVKLPKISRVQKVKNQILQVQKWQRSRAPAIFGFRPFALLIFWVV